MKPHLVIVGPPGAGKGTQAVGVSEDLGIEWISTGQIFRDVMAGDSELGQKVAALINGGDLVPDSVTNQVVASKLDEIGPKAGFLLDGYPRNLAQVDALDGLLAERGMNLDAVLELQIPDEAIVGRLLNRAKVENRQDDTEEVIRHRIAVYHESTMPLLDVYRERGLVVSVDGMGTIDEVRDRLVVALRTFLNNRR